MMLAQTWMVPQQKYDVIHYIREHFLRNHNPGQYFNVTEDYLARLPKGSSRGPEPQLIEPWVTMDYGPMLTTTIQFGEAPDNIETLGQNINEPQLAQRELLHPLQKTVN